jgi:hypothetical protein
VEAQVASIKDFEGRAIGPYALHSQTESRVLIRTELVIGQARDEAQVASILRQTITGKAGFIASSKNKTWKQTKVLSESDVYSVSPRR